MTPNQPVPTIPCPMDGYHTFKELYEFRLLYNAALFNEWAKQKMYNVHKSWRHSDGEKCFGGGWFVVVAELPTGQITNHYEEQYYALFRVNGRTRAAEWDGHTPADVAKRLRGMIEQQRLRSMERTDATPSNQGEASNGTN